MPFHGRYYTAGVAEAGKGRDTCGIARVSCLLTVRIMYIMLNPMSARGYPVLRSTNPGVIYGYGR